MTMNENDKQGEPVQGAELSKPEPGFHNCTFTPAPIEHGVIVGSVEYEAQPVQPTSAQEAARYEYLEQFTQCIKTPNGDLAWTIQLQQVLVGDTFGKAVDAAIEAEKAKGGAA